jgi:hypothetical protein
VPAASRWTPGRLRIANTGVALVHIAQAALVLVLANGFAITVVGDFQNGPPGTDAFTREELFDIAFAPAVALFLLLAAADHLLVAAPRINGWYEANLDRRINVARWAEYSVSASVMIVLIALLTGIVNVYALVAIFGANAAMILFGWIAERDTDPGRTDWLPYVFGCVAGIVPWIAITIALVGAERTGDVPGFVYGIFVSLFVLFNCFAVNFVLQYRRTGPWRDYRFGELVYILLSLTAKSALAWQVYAGALAG